MGEKISRAIKKEKSFLLKKVFGYSTEQFVKVMEQDKLIESCMEY